MEVEAKYITAMINKKTGQFPGTLFMLIQYLIIVYGIISPSQFIDLEQGTKEIHCDPQILINTVLTQVKYLLEYRKLDKLTYT